MLGAVSDPSESISALRQAVEARVPQAVALRRAIHQHPELAGKEQQTAPHQSDFVADEAAIGVGMLAAAAMISAVLALTSVDRSSRVERHPTWRRMR
jgi:2-oxo-4-hydroxy-4-carboxy--5-ureidoimidazoline (OHCU) decarboxylase